MLSVHVSPDKVEHHDRNQMALMPVLIKLKIEGPCTPVADHLYLDQRLFLLSVFDYTDTDTEDMLRNPALLYTVPDTRPSSP